MRGATALKQPLEFAMAEHTLMTGHKIQFQDMRILDTSQTYWDSVLNKAVAI